MYPKSLTKPTFGVRSTKRNTTRNTQANNPTNPMWSHRRSTRNDTRIRINSTLSKIHNRKWFKRFHKFTDIVKNIYIYSFPEKKFKPPSSRECSPTDSRLSTMDEEGDVVDEHCLSLPPIIAVQQPSPDGATCKTNSNVVESSYTKV